MSCGFKEFLPRGYTHLFVYDKNKKTKLEINADLIVSLTPISSEEMAVFYYEGNRTKAIIAPYTVKQVLNVFSEGKINES